MTTTDPTSTALAVPDTPPAASIPSTWAASWRLAQRISSTPFVPGALRGRPESVLAAILFGNELGIGPMQALSQINVIDGRPAAAPELMRALVVRAGHRIDVVELGDERVVLHGRRADTGAEATVAWTMADAQRAGLAGRGSWKQYPRPMLLARATSELCRALFPDVISGLSYTPEEVASINASPDWTTEPAADDTRDTPAPPPPGKPDPAALFERVKATAGTELADRLRSLAERAGRRLTAADFHAHPVWASVVQDVLDDHERRTSTEHELTDEDPFGDPDEIEEADLVDLQLRTESAPEDAGSEVVE